MSTVSIVRYALAADSGLNVIYWEARDGRRRLSYYITLPGEWYDKTKEGPQRALKRFVTGFDFKGVDFDYIAPMYNLPSGRSICLNINGNPYNPYGLED